MTLLNIRHAVPGSTAQHDWLLICGAPLGLVSQYKSQISRSTRQLCVKRKSTGDECSCNSTANCLVKKGQLVDNSMQAGLCLSQCHNHYCNICFPPCLAELALRNSAVLIFRRINSNNERPACKLTYWSVLVFYYEPKCNCRGHKYLLHLFLVIWLRVQFPAALLHWDESWDERKTPVYLSI